MKLFKNKKKKIHLSKRKKEKLRLKEKEEKNKRKMEKKKNNNTEKYKPFLGGIAVGIANIIPGVSGGTMMVIFNLFDKLTYSISDFFKKKTDTRKESFIYIMKVLIGTAIGLVAFAKILGLALKNMEAETVFWFVGLILFSVPLIIKKEMKNQKFSILYFLMGASVIVVLEYFNLKGVTNISSDDGSFTSYIVMILLGAIGGATMIFPGISGSMVMLVLGKYEMIRSYIDKVTTLDINVFIKLGVFAFGALLGIVISSKILSKLLTNHKAKTMSLILGFIVASALILPLNLENEIVFSTEKICGILVSFILGGIVIYYLDKLEKKNSE